MQRIEAICIVHVFVRLITMLVIFNTMFVCMVLKSDERVPTELKKAIMQARGEKKLTQSQLAQVLSLFSVSLSLCC